jgi:hypothetical protein
MIYDIVIAISLERRKDRRERLELHLAERGFKNVYFLPAFDGAKITPGVVSVIPPHRPYFSFRDEITNFPNNKLNRFQIGCIMSHISALKFSKMLGAKTALIVEDDVEFPENIQDILVEVEKEGEPFDWEMIYLGGAIRNFGGKSSIKVAPHLIRPGFTDGIQAFLIREEGFDKLINSMLSFKTTADDAINDVMFREKDPLRAYMRKPKCAFQIADFSEIQRGFIDRQDLRKEE